MEALETGTYTIFNKGYDLPVSRNIIEDRSGNPKRVLTLPKPLLPELAKWEIKRLNNGNYTLSVKGGHTANIGGQVFAVLLPEPRATEWKIEPVFQMGQNCYLISEANTPNGWVVPDEAPETQVAVRIHVMHPSHPPRYPTSQVFVIVKC